MHHANVIGLLCSRTELYALLSALDTVGSPPITAVQQTELTHLLNRAAGRFGYIDARLAYAAKLGLTQDEIDGNHDTPTDEAILAAREKQVKEAHDADQPKIEVTGDEKADEDPSHGLADGRTW